MCHSSQGPQETFETGTGYPARCQARMTRRAFSGYIVVIIVIIVINIADTRLARGDCL